MVHKRRKLDANNYALQLHSNDIDVLWLDWLPDETLQLITHLLPSPNGILSHPHSNSLLALACASSHQRTVVREKESGQSLCCRKKYKKNSYDRFMFMKWYGLVGDVVREVELPTWKDVHSDEKERYISILQRPNMESVRTFPGRKWLESLRGLPHLSSLSIDAAHEGFAEPFLKTLKTLSLTKLSLTCQHYNWHETKCFFNRLCEVGSWATATYCPGTQKLKLECFRADPTNAVAIISSFPALEDVTFDFRLNAVHSSAIEVLRKYASVNIKCASRRACTAIGSIGVNISTLQFWDEPESGLSRDDIIKMKDCTGLKELQICLSPSLDSLLSLFALTIENLQVLHVYWRPVRKGYIGTDFGKNYRSPKGSVLKLISKVRLLKELYLYQLSLSRKEIDSILKELGLRLCKFGFSRFGHHEHSFWLTEFIINRLATHNNCLRHLRLRGRSNGTDSSPDSWDLVTEKDKSLLVDALRVLGKRTQISASELDFLVSALPLPPPSGELDPLLESDGSAVIIGNRDT